MMKYMDLDEIPDSYVEIFVFSRGRSKSISQITVNTWRD